MSDSGLKIAGSEGWFSPSGFVEYHHEKGEKGGSFPFKFNLVDPDGNKVIDQSFFISVLGTLSFVAQCFE